MEGNKNCKNLILKSGVVGLVAVILYMVVFTVFQTPIYENSQNENLNLVIKATGEKREEAFANNVRITDIYVNDEEFDLTKIKLTDGWEYDSEHHMLYVYNTLKPASISVDLQNVRSLDIVYVQEVGSGVAEFIIDGTDVNTVDCYKNCVWETAEFNYEANVFVGLYDSLLMLGAIFVLGFILSFVLGKKKINMPELADYVKFICINVLLSLVLFVFIVIVERESFVEAAIWALDHYNYFVGGLSVIVLLNMLISAVFNRNYVPFVSLSVVFMVLLVINFFKMELRVTPLLPWDFLLAGVVASVVGEFKLVPSKMLVISILLFVAVVVVLRKFKGKIDGAGIGAVARILTALAGCAFMAVYLTTFLLTTDANLFNVRGLYEERGFVLGFTENMRYLKSVDQPEGYSEQAMSEIYDKIQSSEYTGEKKPNIILLMSESFWDITRVPELAFNEEIFPTYRKLQQTSLTGELLANVYGGGTVNSEFEAITGFSVAYLPSEYMPYQRCMREDFFSINSFLKAQGYESFAMHPYYMANYNRNIAYDYMGFEDTAWKDDFDEDTDKMRGYVSDHALVERIIEEYEEHEESSDAPWFNLSVSMQNHGGYQESSIDEGMDFNVDMSFFKESTQGSIKDMVIGLHYADLALGQLIEYFENVDEPTLIIMFGDHMSDAGPIGETLLEQSSLMESNGGTYQHSVLEQRRVPFMSWSNFGTTQKDCGILSITQLLPTVFSEYGVIMPQYFAYLKDSQEIYSACASDIVVDKEGNLSSVADMTDEQRQLYEEGRLIVYDYLFGENYLKNLFDY